MFKYLPLYSYSKIFLSVLLTVYVCMYMLYTFSDKLQRWSPIIIACIDSILFFFFLQLHDNKFSRQYMCDSNDARARGGCVCVLVWCVATTSLLQCGHKCFESHIYGTLEHIVEQHMSICVSWLALFLCGKLFFCVPVVVNPRPRPHI